MVQTVIPPMGTVIGDSLPGAPELAARGHVPTGTLTCTFTRKAVPSFSEGLSRLPLPLADRELMVQVWYPAHPDDTHPPIVYKDYMGRLDLGNLKSFRFCGRAHDRGDPDVSSGPYPVVVLSHGYPGSMFLLSNLAENLSSKGYVVFSIAHADNTYADFIREGSFESALVHRTMDQRALLDKLPMFNLAGPLSDLLDLEQIAMIGFSMGGFGLLRTLGAKVNPEIMAQYSPISEYLKEPEWHGDPRVKAAVLFAPATFLIDADDLSDIRVPTLWVCGTMDRTVGYEKVHAAFKNAVNSHRTMISYTACGHNVANNPAPQEALSEDWSILKRWADPVWDTARLNTLNCHFVTAFLSQTFCGLHDEIYYAGLTEERPFPGFVPETDAGVSIEHISVNT